MEKAKCKVDVGGRPCDALLSCTGGSTKGLIDHLKRIHKINSNSATLTEPKENDTPPVKRQRLLTDYTKSMTFEEGISYEIAVVGLNFEQLINSKMCSTFAKDYFPTKKLPKNGSGVAKIVREFYEKAKSDTIFLIQKHLKNGNFFSSTLDEWTSTAGRRFLNINIHYIDKGVGKEINLGLVPIRGSASAINIKELVSF